MKPPKKPLHPSWFAIFSLLMCLVIIAMDYWRPFSDQIVQAMRFIGFEKLFIAYSWQAELIIFLAGGATGGVLMIPFWLIIKKWRASYDRYKRWEKGLCVECGYDLRGRVADEKCPECGAVIPEKVVQ